MSVPVVVAIVAPFLLIALELYFGCAVLGWAGDKMVVEKEKTPGPYWFAIVLHVVVAVFFAFLLVAASF